LGVRCLVSALVVATCRDLNNCAFPRMRRQAAADQSGDRSPHSKKI
jgi:hypothetical protein